jgi:hypothetical protein
LTAYQTVGNYIANEVQLIGADTPEEFVNAISIATTDLKTCIDFLNDRVKLIQETKK